MHAHAIELRNVSKRYPTGGAPVSALRSVSLRVSAGAFAAIRGPSGSGKSTLLNICGLLDDCDEGEYQLNGTPMQGVPEAVRTAMRRQAIGFIFQSYNLIPVMSVRDNVAYPLRLLGWSESRRRAQVDKLLAQVGLSAEAERRPDHLSGGQRQRVAIARALVKAPTLVIADEPTANLDTATANQVISLMHDLGRKQATSFLIATHDDRMLAHCDQVFSLMDGALA